MPPEARVTAQLLRALWRRAVAAKAPPDVCYLLNMPCRLRI